MLKRTLIVTAATCLCLAGAIFASASAAEGNVAGASVAGQRAAADAPAPVQVAPAGASSPTQPVTTETKSLYETYKKEPALTTVDIAGRSTKQIKEMFYVHKISKAIWKDMQGKSYHKGCPMKKDDLRVLRILYYGYDKKHHIGEMVINKKLAKEAKTIFYKLYKKKYQIHKMQRIDAYGGDDDASIADDNTSCFNYRNVDGSSNLSKHSYGRAIDINPFHNPYVHKVNGKWKVSPPKAKKYADRSKKFKHKITHSDYCFKLFKKAGYIWGGDWYTVKDYQHFQKV